MKNKKKILLISGTIFFLVIIMLVKSFTNKKESNQISYNEVFIQAENEISNTENSIETIKVHIAGEVNKPRTY